MKRRWRFRAEWLLVILGGMNLMIACQGGGVSALVPTATAGSFVGSPTQSQSVGPGDMQSQAATTPPFVALPSTTPSPSFTPLPGIPTPQPTATTTPSLPPGWRPSPTRWRYVTRTPTITPTPTPPPPFMRINRPGPYSKLISPVRVEALIAPGEDGYVYVDLSGEDGRYLVRQALDFRAYRDQRFYIAPEVPFEIEVPAEVARLVIYTLDRFGRTIYLCSSEVILQQMGRTVLEPAQIDWEPYLVRSPKPGETVHGGVLVVRGLARLVNANPLLIELIAEDGQVVGSAEVALTPPYGDLSHVPFEAYVPYTVSGPTEARLTLRQESATRLPGTVALSSLLVRLER